MTVVINGINAGVFWCISCWLRTGLDGNVDGITLWFYFVMELGGFQIVFWGF